MIPDPATQQQYPSETVREDKPPTNRKSDNEQGVAPTMMVRAPSFDLLMPMGQPVAVIRNIAGDQITTSVHPFTIQPSVGEPRVLRVPGQTLPLRANQGLTATHFLVQRPAPGPEGKVEVENYSFVSYWPLPQPAQTAPAPAQNSTPPAKNPPSAAEKPGPVDEFTAKMGMVVRHLKSWGFECADDPYDLDVEVALNFVSALDPATKNYRVAVRCVSILYKFGLINDDIDDNRAMPLILAVRAARDKDRLSVLQKKRNLQLIKKVISEGAKIDTRDGKGRTALMHAITWDLHDIASTLVKAGAQLNCEDQNRHNVWWYAAVFSTEIKTLNLLDELSNTNSIINVQDKKGKTPLMVAIRRVQRKSSGWHGQTNIVQKLLSSGSNPTLADKAGDNAWIYAARSGMFCLFEILGHYDNAGIAINAKNLKGETALSIAEQRMQSDRKNAKTDSGVSTGVNTDFRTDLYRFGAVPTDRKMARKYQDLREFEAKLIGEFVSIQTRLTQLHATELARLEAECARSPNLDDYPAYGGSRGNNYFRFYTSRIAEPALAEFFKSAKVMIHSKNSGLELFAPVFLQILLRQVGQMRRHIHTIVSTNTPNQKNDFGEPLFSGIHVVDPVNGYSGWHEHVLKEIKKNMLEAFDECLKHRNSFSLNTLFKRMGKNDSYKFYASDEGESYFFKKPGTGAFEIFPPKKLADKATLRRSDIVKMDDLTIKCHHKNYPMNSASSAFAAEALISAIMLPDYSVGQRHFSRELFNFMKHSYRSSYLSRGMASFTEWVVAGVCRSHGFTFDYPDWKTDGDRENFALDHAFLSDFDGSLARKFMRSVSFSRVGET